MEIILAEWIMRYGLQNHSQGGARPSANASVGVKVSTSMSRRGFPRADARGPSIAAWNIAMEPNKAADTQTPELADDLLRGADEIATFIFGERGSRRKVYYLAETSHLPVFRLGAVLCARKSVLLRWISGQESRVKPPGA